MMRWPTQRLRKCQDPSEDFALAPRSREPVEPEPEEEEEATAASCRPACVAMSKLAARKLWRLNRNQRPPRGMNPAKEPLCRCPFVLRQATISESRNAFHLCFDAKPGQVAELPDPD